MKFVLFALCLLIASTASAEIIKIDDTATLDTKTMFVCERHGILIIPGKNPIVGGRITSGNKSIKFVVDTELTKIGLLSETVFNSWGDIIGYTDFTKSKDSVSVNIAAAASAGSVAAIASTTARVHSYEVNWQRPDRGTALEKYYFAAMAQYENNLLQLVEQSKQFGYIEAIK